MVAPARPWLDAEAWLLLPNPALGFLTHRPEMLTRPPPTPAVQKPPLACGLGRMRTGGAGAQEGQARRAEQARPGPQLRGEAPARNTSALRPSRLKAASRSCTPRRRAGHPGAPAPRSGPPPADPPPLALLHRLTFPRLLALPCNAAVDAGHAWVVGLAPAPPSAPFPAGSHPRGPLPFANRTRQRVAAPRGSLCMCNAGGQLGGERGGGAEGPAGRSLAGRRTSCATESGRRQEGWAVAWSREQARTRWGPEWPLRTVTRARPRARGDLQKERGLEEISGCHAVPPWSLGSRP